MGGYSLSKEYVLRMENIRKEYFGNLVLKGINLKIKPGEIHAFLEKMERKIYFNEYTIWYACNTWHRWI